jgi:hypothetical protein
MQIKLLTVIGSAAILFAGCASEQRTNDKTLAHQTYYDVGELNFPDGSTVPVLVDGEVRGCEVDADIEYENDWAKRGDETLSVHVYCPDDQ